MSRLAMRLVATAAALFVAERLVDGVDMETGLPLAQTVINLGLIALIFGLVNTLIRPLIKASTCMINILTLGLFTFVINALMLWLTSAIAQQFDLGFQVNGLGPALLGAIVVSIASLVLGVLVPDK